MKKIIAVILSSFLLLLFFGCQTNKANDNENSADTHKKISSEEMSSAPPSSSDNELSGIGELSFTVSLNVFTVDGDGVDSCGYKADIPKDGTMTLRVSTSVAPDSKMIQKNISVRLWIIADDEPVEFGLDPAEEQNIYQDIMVDAGIEKLINIVFDVKKEINNLFIWCFPSEPSDFLNILF